MPDANGKPRIFYVNDAMPTFKESDHPRDNSGKFSETSGGGGAAAKPATAAPSFGSPGKYVPNNNLKYKAFGAGFKKGKEENGMPTFIHPSGLKVVVHPTPGQKGSSKWALHKGEEKHEGKGGDKLETLLKNLSFSLAPTPTPSGHSPGADHVNKQMKDYGFSDPVTNGPVSIWMSGDVYAKYNDENGEWKVWDEGGHSDKGYGYASFKNGVYAAVGPGLEEHEEETAAAVHPSSPAPASNAATFLANKGYTLAESGPKSDIFTTPSGAKVEFTPETEEWVAITPNHMPKEGTGLASLQQLMSGQPAIIPPGGSAPWKNTQKTIMTASEKEGQAKIAAQAAEANKWSAEHQEKYKKVMAAAPVPTPAQRTAISKYSGSSYATMNDALRHNPGALKNDQHVKALDDYLNNASFPVDFTVERGVKGEYAKILKSVIHPGGTFVDRGYSSTSGRIGGGWTGLKMKITCPAGSKGASIRAHSQHSSEDEILLPRNAVFKVLKMESDMIHLEYQGTIDL